MRICVTGGSGFIGTYICEALRAAGHGPVALDLVEPPHDAPWAEFIQGDIRDARAVRRALAGCGAVLHLAAAHHDFGIEPDEYFDVNRRGAQVLCDAMAESGIELVCFYSTVALYGDAPEPLSEQTRPAPNSPYGASKLAAEEVLRRWAEAQSRRRCLVLRPAVVMGPRNVANVHSLIRQIHSGWFVPVGKGDNVKSMAYVENLVAATLYLCGLDTPNGQVRFDGRVGVFNYVDKPDMTARRIVGEIYDALGRRAPRWSLPLSPVIVLGMPFDLVIKLTGRNLPISTARIRKLCTQTKFEAEKIQQTGFTARTPVSEGLRRMTQWFAKQHRKET